jgi:toxin ParE1/3/4
MGRSEEAHRCDAGPVGYSVHIRPAALADIEQAARWYDGEQPGLGTDFAQTVRCAIDDLPSNPLMYRLRNRRRNVRWLFPPRFPYRIVYQMRGERITVVAVVHAARRDRHWKQRLE